MNNSLTYNDSSKFRAISNKPISDKVENLYDYKFENLTIKDVTNIVSTDGINITKFGKIIIVNFLNVPMVRNKQSTSYKLPDWVFTKISGVFPATGVDFTGFTAEIYLRTSSKTLEFNDTTRLNENRFLSGQVVVIENN